MESSSSETWATAFEFSPNWVSKQTTYVLQRWRPWVIIWFQPYEHAFCAGLLLRLCFVAVTVRAFNISFHNKRDLLKLAIVLLLLLAQKSHYCEKNQTSGSFRWSFVLWSGNSMVQELIEVWPWSRLTVTAWLGGVFLTRRQLCVTFQSLLGACGEPRGSTVPGLILARKAFFSDLCAVKHISRTGWGAVIRVKIVFLTLKIYPICHFTGIFDVVGLRESQKESLGVFLLKLRKTGLVQVLLRNISAVEISFVEVRADFHRLFKRILSLITQI